MKDCMKVRHFLSLVLAAGVTILTLSVIVHATQVITSPNAAFFTYSLAAGANSAPITPVGNQSVLVMGTETFDPIGNGGVGFVTMVHFSQSGAHFLIWTGIESFGPITAGTSATAGTHIVWLDAQHTVDIQAHTGDTFVVHNANSFPLGEAGNVTLIW